MKSLMKLTELWEIGAEEVVVVVITGHGFKEYSVARQGGDEYGVNGCAPDYRLYKEIWVIVTDTINHLVPTME